MPNNSDPTTNLSQPVVYQIRIKGHLGRQWTDWFEGLTITLVEDGDTYPNLLARTPRQLQPESWGSGYVDYPSMVQPIPDKHCVSCHGGEKDIAAAWAAGVLRL